MKKILALLLSLAMVFSFASVASFADGTDPSSAVPKEKIPDEVLYQCILDQVNQNKEANDQEKVEAFTYGDLDGITQLLYFQSSEQTITDLTGIDLCENLEVLSLYGCSLSDLQPLSSLQNLRELYLTDCGISSIVALEPLKEQLVTLDVSINQLKDISLLSGFTNLEILGIASNQISALEAIAELKSLKVLDVSDNFISDFSVAEGFDSLEMLSVSDNLIDMSDADTVAFFEGLEDNDIWVNNLSQMPKDGYHYEKSVTIYHDEILDELMDLITQKINGKVIKNQRLYTIEEPGEYVYTSEINPEALLVFAKAIMKQSIYDAIEYGQSLEDLFPDFTYAGEVPTEDEIDAYVNAFFEGADLEELLDQMTQEYGDLNYTATFKVGEETDPGESETPSESEPSSPSSKPESEPGGTTSSEESGNNSSSTSATTSSASSSSKSPVETGDNTNIIMPVILMMLSGLAMVGMVVNNQNQGKRRKRVGRHFR